MSLSFKEKHQPCTKCGKKIIMGVNGCMLHDLCFDCNNGPYTYAPGVSNKEPAFQDLNEYDVPPPDFNIYDD